MTTSPDDDGPFPATSRSGRSLEPAAWIQSPSWRDAETHFRRLHEPAFGRPHRLRSVSASDDGSRIAVSGSVYDELEGFPRTAAYAVRDGHLRELSDGTAIAAAVAVSPDGKRIAYARGHEDGSLQLHLLDAEGDIATPGPRVPGTIEYCAWSPDSRRVLLGVAGLDADLSGGQGARGISETADSERPAWFPSQDTGAGADSWRSLWVYDDLTGALDRVSPLGLNPWEGVWLGPGALAAVASDAPGEAAWYSARLVRISLDGGVEALLTPEVQLGWPAGSPDGDLVAVSVAISSDRWLVAGNLFIGGVDRPFESVDTLGISVSATRWIDDTRIGIIGLRGLETVAAIHDVRAGTTTVVWSSTETSCGLYHPEGTWIGDGRLLVVEEGYDLPPRVVLIAPGDDPQELASVSNTGTDYLRSVAGTAEPVSWNAPDGLLIEGILCLPPGDGPHPLVINIHGGPVWSYRNVWMMTFEWTPYLVSRGYAVLSPNPRGSSGRGQEFAARVIGDMGGEDTGDFTSAVDALAARGLIDPQRVGLTGVSYGGYMSSWLVTQDQRWAAAVPSSPVTDWYSQHYTSNISTFDALALQDDPTNAEGRYHSRSPVFLADRVRTPCLHTTGALDQCTPPTQAQEFHRALLRAGVESELVVYPREGHSIYLMPEMIDYCARMAEWFERHMPPMR